MNLRGTEELAQGELMPKRLLTTTLLNALVIAVVVVNAFPIIWIIFAIYRLPQVDHPPSPCCKPLMIKPIGISSAPISVT